jgi:hypothetical protein
VEWTCCRDGRHTKYASLLIYIYRNLLQNGPLEGRGGNGRATLSLVLRRQVLRIEYGCSWLIIVPVPGFGMGSVEQIVIEQNRAKNCVCVCVCTTIILSGCSIG